MEIKAKGRDFFFLNIQIICFIVSSVKFFSFNPVSRYARFGLCLTNPFFPTQVEQLLVWVAHTVSEGNSQKKMLFMRNDPVGDRGLSDDGSRQRQIICNVGEKKPRSLTFSVTFITIKDSD